MKKKKEYACLCTCLCTQTGTQVKNSWKLAVYNHDFSHPLTQVVQLPLPWAKPMTSLILKCPIMIHINLQLNYLLSSSELTTNLRIRGPYRKDHSVLLHFSHLSRKQEELFYICDLSLLLWFRPSRAGGSEDGREERMWLALVASYYVLVNVLMAHHTPSLQKSVKLLLTVVATASLCGNGALHKWCMWVWGNVFSLPLPFSYQGPIQKGSILLWLLPVA